ncbi:response regulator transcription factor [Sphingobacterium humi]|uniref:Helix-turn-helix transcriptional regulator n=1 Tax=Sphingobacterium humi TaxID=1796905 RepID=A0A6N8KTC6_9SPHI|nr:helix-turn-helix transcriptional regulator [Sphingobacterium humi]MVZ60690.1 helix-turn-helix transcriptional regulator [Sphingobacterium humi]
MHRIFFKSNTIKEDELNKTFDYKDVIYAFERLIYESIYTIDYEKQSFEYVSENPLFLCGYLVDEVRGMGIDFYFKNVVLDDLELLIKVNKVGSDFYDKIPLSDKKLYTISCDFHLKTNDNKRILVNQKLTPMFLTDKGSIWKALCIVSLSTAKTSGNIKISKKGYNQELYFDLKDERWKSIDGIKLSEREKEILRLSIRGFTINDIGNEIFVSPETVKFHRKKLFTKLGVSSMPEAIFYAANNKLI